MNIDRFPTTIYVALIDEGTDCWRPVAAEQMQGNLYRILGRIPDGERWRFQPGEVVRCEQRSFQDGDGLVAVELGLPSSGAPEAGAG